MQDPPRPPSLKKIYFKIYNSCTASYSLREWMWEWGVGGGDKEQSSVVSATDNERSVWLAVILLV